ncbi:hypothetical protein CDD83_916 [Cordyceps sp. RAO-2017]|nr:hypothetical protein CDD83_916 [Cordyceps sp. RAO-2017]
MDSGIPTAHHQTKHYDDSRASAGIETRARRPTASAELGGPQPGDSGAKEDGKTAGKASVMRASKAKGAKEVRATRPGTIHRSRTRLSGRTGLKDGRSPCFAAAKTAGARKAGGRRGARGAGDPEVWSGRLGRRSRSGQAICCCCLRRRRERTDWAQPDLFGADGRGRARRPVDARWPHGSPSSTVCRAIAKLSKAVESWTASGGDAWCGTASPPPPRLSLLRGHRCKGRAGERSGPMGQPGGDRVQVDGGIETGPTGPGAVMHASFGRRQRGRGCDEEEDEDEDEDEDEEEEEEEEEAYDDDDDDDDDDEAYDDDTTTSSCDGKRGGGGTKHRPLTMTAAGTGHLTAKSAGCEKEDRSGGTACFPLPCPGSCAAEDVLFPSCRGNGGQRRSFKTGLC